MTEIYKEYLDVQREHFDAFVLTRLGDFYEIMGPKAQEAAPLLDLTLTRRNVGVDENGVPMVGFPLHAAE